MIALARYVVDRSTRLADVAFLVHDDFQGRGIGTWLLRRLLEIARERGVQGFVARLPTDNARMLHILHRCGMPIESRLQDGAYTITLRFEGAGLEVSPLRLSKLPSAAHRRPRFTPSRSSRRSPCTPGSRCRDPQEDL